MKDLHALPRVRDSLTYLYLEQCRVEQEAKSITVFDKRGSVAVPAAALSLLLLGPGATVTHAAIRTLAENGCMVCWTGEGAVRLYAHSTGETRSARNLIRQAALASDPGLRLQVINRMYRIRFAEELPQGLSLQQLRGREGLRVRQAYARASEESGVPWQGRFYDRSDWRRSNPINRALSTASSALYGICHAAIVATGYSPGLGFIHTGKMLSFVYDIADLYKAELSIPIAFRTVAESERNLESRVRQACRDAFYRGRLLERIIPDISKVLGFEETTASLFEFDGDGAVPAPGWLWDGDTEPVAGGVNYSGSAGPDVADIHDMETDG
ncbi:MAG: type I-E CRISPR-associated endonuclease Cas1e [Dehalococcoidia bacterium]|nr:type I-E CRISPR-associated endonuclease Cas1e [Dehalococcoidia bacterium]